MYVGRGPPENCWGSGTPVQCTGGTGGSYGSAMQPRDLHGPQRAGPLSSAPGPARPVDMVSYFYRARPGPLKFRPGPARPVYILDP